MSRSPRALLHPAVWLCAWGAFALLLQRLDIFGLLMVAAPGAMLAGWLARLEAYRMLKRARWLLLSIAVLFLVATPGVRMAGILGVAGVSHDGIVLAGENILRLSLLLATLATLLKVLGPDGVLCGIDRLLTPIGRYRERLVARLMLTLELAGRSDGRERWQDWLAAAPHEETEAISLATSPLRAVDRVFLVLFFVITCGILFL